MWVSNFPFLKAPDRSFLWFLLLLALICALKMNKIHLCSKGHTEKCGGEIWWFLHVNLCLGMVGMLKISQPVWGLHLCLSVSSPCWLSGCQAQTQAIYLKRFHGGNLFWERDVSILTCISVPVVLNTFLKGFQVVLVVITETKRKWNILKCCF